MQEDNLFIPDSITAKRYKQQLAILLESDFSNSNTIDMGKLPPVYTVLGITDKELKTNFTTIQKALGLKGKNKHDVQMETIENLLSLTYDPEGVFKSLSKSDNPNAYIAVLNAEAKNQEQIIAILSPSSDGQGFTFVPSVYNKHNFEKFLERTYEEQKVLYIKNKGSKLWGQLQSLPRHNSEPYTANILTKDDIVKQIAQYNPASLEADKNNKEQRMSDYMDEPEQPGMEQIEWDENNVLQHEVIADSGYTYTTFFKVAQFDSPNNTNIYVTPDPEGLEYMTKGIGFVIEGTIDDAKRLVESAVNILLKQKNLFYPS